MSAVSLRFLGIAFCLQFIFLTNLHSQTPGYWKNRLLFKIDNSLPANVQKLADLQRNQQTKAIYQLLTAQKGIKFGKVFEYASSTELDRSFRVTLPANIDVADLMRKLELIPAVDYAEREPRHKGSLVPNDPSYSGQYAMGLIQAAAAFNIHTGGNAFVAIVDDACRITHQDLAANIRVNPNEIPGNLIDDDGNGKVDDMMGWDVADNDSNVNPPASANNNYFSHGTHVSGIACAVTNNGVGIASIGFNCKILPVKCTGNGADPEFIDEGFSGIDYAYRSGARVISCSWGGGGFSNTFNNFINTMFNNGVTVVCAAGNDGNSTTFYPAGYTNAIAVAATGSTDIKAGFSNYGTWVDISAPGVGIYSTVAGSSGSNSSYTNYNGTSMSTPMVAGLLTLMLSYDPSLTAADLRSCLMSSATNIDAQNPTFIGQLGAGRINALAALQCVGANLVPTPDFTWAPNAEICAGGKVQFTDASSGGPTSRTWSFPGGNPSSSSATNPLVTYANQGTYDVTLTVGNGNGSNSVTKTGIIVVGPGGLDNFFSETFETGLGGWAISNPDNLTTWAQVTALGSRSGTKAAALNNFSYAGGTNQRDAITNVSPWDFRGRESIILSLDHAYRGKASGATDTLNIYVSVNNGVSFPFKVYSGFIGPNGVFQTGTAINTPFVPASQNDWCFGTSNNNCISVDLSQFAGRQQVKIKFENVSKLGNTIYIDNIKLTSSCYQVIAPPVADFSGDPVEACHSSFVGFSDESSANIIAWDWSFPGGNPSTSNEQYPAVNYTQPGFYNVTLVATNAGGSTTKTKNQFVKIYDDPVPFFEYTINGTNVTFINQSGGGTQQALSYFWDFGDGQFSSATNPVHHYNADGNYTVRLEATNPCGTVSFYQDVQVVSLPNAAFTSSNSIGCTPLTVSYFDNSFSTIDSWQWSFPGGVPNVSGSQNPVVTYSTSGSYPVTLIVNNSVGSDTLMLNTYVQVSAGANANFTAAVNGLIANFSNGSSGTNLTYAWKFGDNTTSTVLNPSHTYAMPGVYVVQLIVSNSCSSDTFVQSVSIQSIPVAIFQSITQVQCIPAQVQFHDNSQGDITFRKWTFSGGNPSQSALADPVVTYANAGVYAVSLIVGNAAGNDTIVIDFAVTVEDVPIANFDVIIASNMVQMNNGSVNGAAWQWDFGDNTFSNMKDPGHEYTANGTYTIVLVASNSCGSDTFSKLVQIAVPQAAHFNFQSIGNCAPITVKYSDQSVGNPTQWDWAFEGGVPATSTEQNPTVVYQNAGYYGVNLISRNGNIADTLWQDSLIEVRGKPVSAFSNITTGLEVDFSNQTLLGASYHWSFGDGDVSTEIDPTHIYSTVDTFEVVLVAVNECGSDSTKRTIFTGGIPPAGGFEGNIVAGCAPFEVHFGPINAKNWDEISWLFPGGNPATSADANPIVIYENAGEYAVQMSLSNTFGTTVVTVDSFITVGDKPNANFAAEIVGLEGIFSNLSLSGQSFFWDFGDGSTSTELEPSHLFSGNGNYTVTLIATNACGSDTIVQNLQITAIHSLIDLGWRLYPNPANSRLWVSAPAIQANGSRWVFINFLGQKISANPYVNNKGNLFEFDLTNVPAGYWYLQMQNADSIYYGKILIEK